MSKFDPKFEHINAHVKRPAKNRPLISSNTTAKITPKDKPKKGK